MRLSAKQRLPSRIYFFPVNLYCFSRNATKRLIGKVMLIFIANHGNNINNKIIIPFQIVRCLYSFTGNTYGMFGLKMICICCRKDTGLYVPSLFRWIFLSYSRYAALHHHMNSVLLSNAVKLIKIIMNKHWIVRLRYLLKLYKKIISYLKRCCFSLLFSGWLRCHFLPT